MKTITEEKQKSGNVITSAQDANRPTKDKPTGDRRSSLYSPTFSSRQKEDTVSPKTKNVVNETTKAIHHKHDGECKIESHHHDLHASRATHLKTNVGLPSKEVNCG